MAEQLGLQQRVLNRAAVDRDERIAGAFAVPMDGTSHQLFSGAAFPHDQYRSRRIGGMCDLFVDLQHRRGPSDEAADRTWRHVRDGLSAARTLTERSVDDAFDLGDDERLADVVE